MKTMILKPLATVGKYLMLMGRTFSRPERMRVYFKQYVNEMVQLGVNSIGIVLLISFFIGAVITIQIKLNIESAWMPRWVVGYTTREIMLLEFSSSIMCLILAGKVGSNIASEIGTMRVTMLKMTRKGIMVIKAAILGRMRYPAELTPMISSASICCVTRMVPISEAMFEPTLPARMMQMMLDANSSSNTSRIA